MSFLTALGIAGAAKEEGGSGGGLGTALIGQGITAGLGAMAARTQYKNQKKLMGLQNQYQMGLNQQGHNLQFDMWNKTNYGAQMEHLKNAGLNPALMYGGAGSGGSTGSQGGGSAAGGQAALPKFAAMDLASNMAQIDLAKSQADKNRAEADFTRGAKTEQTKAVTLNTKVQTQLNDLGLEIGKATKEDQIDEVTYRVEQLVKQNNLTDEQVELVKEQTLESGIRQKLAEANIKLTEEETNAIGEKIRQGWEQILQTYDSLSIQRDNLEMRGYEGQADLKAIEINMLRAVMENEVAWGKLNIEQQKVFVSMATGILSIRPTTTTTTSTESQGGAVKTTKSTRQ